jgi:hypothetical protein
VIRIIIAIAVISEFNVLTEKVLAEFGVFLFEFLD